MAFTLKAFLHQYYLVPDGDRAMQMNAAINLLNGHGYTILEASRENLNLVAYRYLLEWPPLYSLLLVPFLWLTGMDEMLSFTLLDSAGIFFYLLAVWRLVKFLGFPLSWQVVILLLQATGIHSEIQYSFPTDVPAAACLTWGLLFVMRYLRKRQIMQLLLASLVLLAAVLFRYQYAIASISLPLLLAGEGYLMKDRKLLRQALLAVSLTGTGIALLFLFNRAMAGQLAYNYIGEKGFSPWVLQFLTPVFWHAFIDVEFWTMQLSIRTKYTYGEISAWLRISSSLALVVLIIFWIRIFVRNRFALAESKWLLFIQLAGYLSLAILFPLMYFSVSGQLTEAMLEKGFWTYILESRYFLFIYMGIQVSIVAWLLYSGFYVGMVNTLLRSLVITSGIFLFSHCIWILVKYANADKKTYSFLARDTDMAFKLLDAAQQAAIKNGLELVLITSDYGNMHYGLKKGARLFRFPKQLRSNPDLQINRPSLVLFFTGEEKLDQFGDVTRKNNMRLLARANDEEVYYAVASP